MPIASVLHILRTVKDKGGISRTDLQQVTGLSWGTITNTTRELLNRKLIREEGAMATKAGRKPVQLALNPSGHSLIGVDIRMDALRCLVMNLAGEELWHEELALTVGESPETIVQHVAEMVRRALSSSTLVSRNSMGIGVAVPGILDATRSIVHDGGHGSPWRDVPLREMLEAKLTSLGLGGQTVRLELHTNCLSTAERWFGEACQTEDVLCVHLGRTVCLGVVAGGDIFRGSQGAAGEFGHVTVDPQGPACVCGKRGCVDIYAGAPAILEYARNKATGDDPAARATSVAALAELASAGNAAAIETFAHMGRHLGVGITNLIELFNPGLVVLAGPSTVGHAHFIPVLEKEIARVWRPETTRKVVVSQLGERAAAMGACGVVLQAAFEHDAIVRPSLTA